MTTENTNLLRDEIARGNEYLRVINFAIKLFSQQGEFGLASLVVNARNAANDKIAARRGQCA